jgi:hypothetical protein
MIARRGKIGVNGTTYPSQTVDADKDVCHGNDCLGWRSGDLPREDRVVCGAISRKYGGAGSRTKGWYLLSTEST